MASSLELNNQRLAKVIEDRIIEVRGKDFLARVAEASEAVDSATERNRRTVYSQQRQQLNAKVLIQPELNPDLGTKLYMWGEYHPQGKREWHYYSGVDMETPLFHVRLLVPLDQRTKFELHTQYGLLKALMRSPLSSEHGPYTYEFDRWYFFNKSGQGVKLDLTHDSNAWGMDLTGYQAFPRELWDFSSKPSPIDRDDQRHVTSWFSRARDWKAYPH